jgi:hypothetical protein
MESISHDMRDETIEAKAKWFSSLSLTERMDMLCAFTDLAIEIKPELAAGKNAQPTQGRVRVLSKLW